MAKEQVVPTKLPDRKVIPEVAESFCATVMPRVDVKPMDSTLLEKICHDTGFEYK